MNEKSAPPVRQTSVLEKEIAPVFSEDTKPLLSKPLLIGIVLLLLAILAAFLAQ